MNKPQWAVLAACLLLLTWGATADRNAERPDMKITSVAPILLADDVDANVSFWESFGLQATVVVPGPSGASFAILTNGDIEIMYQSFESARKDKPEATKGIGKAVIYLDINSFDELLLIARQYPVAVDEHITPYGIREIYINDPAGNLIGFAEKNEN